MTLAVLPPGAPADNDRLTPSAIYRAILEAIRRGDLKPGARLPNERALAERFGTGRSTVRGALSMMEGQGLVSRKVGSGTYLAPAAGQIFARLDQTTIAAEHQDVPAFVEILEGRLLFEPAMLALVAARATEADLLAMEAGLERILAAPSWIAFKEAIYALHGLIFAAAHNRFLAQLFDIVVADRRAVAFDGRSTANPVAEPVRRQAYDDLKPIIAAIRRRNARAAERAMRDHLLRMLATVNLYQ